MKKLSITLLTITLSFCVVKAQDWKELARDNTVNFYNVCKAADAHFDTIDKNKKGSGYKGFLRWKYDNEFKYYPSGDRSNIDPYFVEKQYNSFLENNPKIKSLFPQGWEELGPTTPGQITDHYSFGMGRIVSFYVDPQNTDILYLGSRTGGFWKSTDGGQTWNGGSTDFLAASGVSTISASPTNSDSILININNSTNHYTHGIYRSTDGGDSWSLSNFNPSNLGWGGLGYSSEIYKIKYHPTVANLIFIGTRNGLFRSSDNLNTWTVPVNYHDFTDIDFHPTNPNIIYAYAKNTPNVVYVSTDMGTNFNTVNIPGNSSEIGTVAVSASCPNCVYYFSNNGYWKSTNNGTSFIQISNPSLSDDGFAVNDLNDNNILAGYLDAYISNDGGLSFNQATYWSLGNTNGAGNGHQTSFNTSTDYIHADLQAAECLNGVFYAVTDGFLVSSADGGINWNILSKDIGIRMNYNLGLSQSNHFRTICGSQDNGTSICTENGWVEMYGADGMEGIIHPLNDDWMIGSVQYGTRRRTFNGGLTNDDATPFNQNAYWIAPIFNDPNDHMTIYSLGENVHKSEDFGETYTNVGSPSFSGEIKFATIAENNSSRIIAVYNNNIELSENGGVTWSSIKSNLPNFAITDVVFDPRNDSTIIVTYGRYQNDNSKVYISYNMGASWTNITQNLGNMPVRSVVIDHTNESNIYLGTEIGVYKKAMSDQNWTLYNTDLPNTSIKELEIMWGSNTLRATTWGRGLWEYSLAGRVDFPAIITTDISSTPNYQSPVENIDQSVFSSIEYDGTLSSVYVKWSINNPTLHNSIDMNNTTGNEWVSDTPLPNYPVGTKMYFKVMAVGDAGDTTETYKFMYTVKPYEYCDANGTNDGSNLRLTNVSIANINNSSANDSYTYYGNQVVNLIKGQSYSITLTGSTSWGQNDYAGWIDFNRDGNFELSEAVVYIIDAGSNTATANFTVPPNAVVEDTLRMRTRIGYWYSQEINPCGSALGEVEDYPVWITCNPSSSIETHVACSEFTWIDDSTYTSSTNTASYIMPNIYGCDSTITLNLNLIGVNASVNGDIVLLTASPANQSYQWMNCDSNSLVVGETGQTFTPNSQGNYAVIITNSENCTDTSECFLVGYVGISDNESESPVKIMPNPTDGKFRVEFGETIEFTELSIYDSSGKLIFSEVARDTNAIDLSVNTSAGMYQLVIKFENHLYIHKLIIK